jgi:hypothetical protein
MGTADQTDQVASPSRFRPLDLLGRILVTWARNGRAEAIVIPEISGRLRAAADNVGIALCWMSKTRGDERSFLKRMTCGGFFWRQAGRALFGKLRRGLK